MSNLCNEPGWSFEELRALNSPLVFSQYDYVRLLRQSGRVSNESLVTWMSNYQPTFKVINGKVFLEELFSAERYQQFLDSSTPADSAQLFVNLINISSIVDHSVDGSVEKIANNIAAAWNSKLSAELPNFKDRARVIYEKDDDEYYVTIDHEK